MKTVIKSTIAILLTALFVTGCSSTPPQQTKQGNSAESQRSHAKQAQDELSRETSR